MKRAIRVLMVIAASALSSCAGVVPAAEPAAQATLVIRDVTVVDVVAGSLRPHMTVIVAGSRIAKVVDAGTIAMPLSVPVVDGRNRFLIPGLWDMHSHSLWSADAMETFLPLYVAQGITGIRDMGGQLPFLATYREKFASDNPPWPRVVAAGEILDGPQPVHEEISVAVHDAERARAAVNALGRAGADFVKVYTLLPREAYFAVIEEAKRIGVDVAGHVPADVTPKEAAAAGQRSIEHLRDEIEPFCSPRDAEACASLASVFRTENTWQVPTLVALRAKAFFDDASLPADPRLQYIPSALRSDWLAQREAKLRRGSAYLASKRERYSDEVWLTGFLDREDVPLLAGSDAGVEFVSPGFGLHQELGLLVQAGLTPLEALRAATLSPAEYLRELGSMGSIEAGKVADMVLLSEDPLSDIAATLAIEAVILRGRLFDRDDLDRLMESVAADAQK